MSLSQLLTVFKTGFKAKAVEVNGNFTTLANAIDTKANTTDVNTSVNALSTAIATKANTTDVNQSVTDINTQITATKARVTSLETVTSVVKVDGTTPFLAEQKGVDATSNTGLTTFKQVNDLLPNRNFIVNGDMRIAQRCPLGNSLPLTTTNQFIIDRFMTSANCATVTAGNIQQVRNTNTFNYAMSMTGVTISGSGAMNGNTTVGYLSVDQRIESFNACFMSNQKVSVSFDVYHDMASSLPVTVRTCNPSAQDNYITTMLNYSLATDQTVPTGVKTRMKFENLTLGDCSNGLAVGVFLKTGATTNNNFYVSNIQIEIGAKCTDFETRFYEQELVSCMRYYEKSYEPMTKPATIEGVTRGFWFLAIDTASPISCNQFKVQKRTTPIVKIYSPTTGVLGNARKNTDGTDVAFTVADISSWGVSRLNGVAVAGVQYSCHYTADAEL